MLDNLISLKQYLQSNQYIEKMLTNTTLDEFLLTTNDAEGTGNNNYNFRHHVNFRNEIGVWRWKPMFINRLFLIDTIFNEELYGLDFGGASAPVSPLVDVVDIQTTDVFQRPVRYNSLNQTEQKADFIITSHTLEHIQDLDSSSPLLARLTMKNSRNYTLRN